MRRGASAKLHAGGVDHVAGFQLASGGNRGAAHRDGADLVAFGLDFQAALAANRAGHASAELQIVVGGVDDGVGLHLRQVALAYLDVVGEIHRGEIVPAHILNSRREPAQAHCAH